MCDRPDCETCRMQGRNATLAGESAAARSQRDVERTIADARPANRWRNYATEGVTHTTPHGPDFYGPIPAAHSHFVLLQTEHTARAWSAASEEEAQRLKRALEAETGMYWRVVRTGD